MTGFGVENKFGKTWPLVGIDRFVGVEPGKTQVQDSEFGVRGVTLLTFWRKLCAV